MPSKKHPKNSPFVYSTNPDFSFDNGEEECLSLPASVPLLKVSLDTKHRKGKVVTLVDGFTGKAEERELLGKKLKTACGTGGSVKDDLIIIQGDHTGKVKSLLLEWGYKVKK